MPNPNRRPLIIDEPLMELPGEDELPCNFGPPMESELHRVQMNELVESLRSWLLIQGDTDTYVAGNMAIYFSATQIKTNDFLGPDVFVVKGTSQRSRKSWVVWWEGGMTPDVVIELLSSTTEKNDRGAKMVTYARSMHVAEYYLFDPIDGRLEGYRLDPNRNLYVVIPPVADELVPCHQLGLRLGIRWEHGEDGDIPHLRWQEPSGAWIPTDRERAKEERIRAEEQRVRAEEQRARAESEQSARLEAETKLAASEARMAELLAKLQAAGLG